MRFRGHSAGKGQGSELQVAGGLRRHQDTNLAPQGSTSPGDPRARASVLAVPLAQPREPGNRSGSLRAPLLCLSGPPALSADFLLSAGSWESFPDSRATQRGSCHPPRSATSLTPSGGQSCVGAGSHHQEPQLLGHSSVLGRPGQLVTQAGVSGWTGTLRCPGAAQGRDAVAPRCLLRCTWSILGSWPPGIPSELFPCGFTQLPGAS